jgi:hypothetical protein
MASATHDPPGAITMPVPVAACRAGRKTVNAGVTTLRITVPIGVLGYSFSFCVQFSEPGGIPAHNGIVCSCARAKPPARKTKTAVAATSNVACRIVRRDEAPMSLCDSARLRFDRFNAAPLVWEISCAFDFVLQRRV